MRHTPTPWHWVEEFPDAIDKEALVAVDGTVVLSPVLGYDRDMGIRTGDWKKMDQAELPKANAEFIVRACNAWDDVNVLRARIAELEGK